MTEQKPFPILELPKTIADKLEWEEQFILFQMLHAYHAEGVRDGIKATLEHVNQALKGIPR